MKSLNEQFQRWVTCHRRRPGARVVRGPNKGAERSGPHVASRARQQPPYPDKVRETQLRSHRLETASRWYVADRLQSMFGFRKDKEAACKQTDGSRRSRFDQSAARKCCEKRLDHIAGQGGVPVMGGIQERGMPVDQTEAYSGRGWEKGHAAIVRGKMPLPRTPGVQASLRPTGR